MAFRMKMGIKHTQPFVSHRIKPVLVTKLITTYHNRNNHWAAYFMLVHSEWNSPKHTLRLLSIFLSLSLLFPSKLRGIQRTKLNKFLCEINKIDGRVETFHQKFCENALKMNIYYISSSWKYGEACCYKFNMLYIDYSKNQLKSLHSVSFIVMCVCLYRMAKQKHRK